jgi:hypothetical protein
LKGNKLIGLTGLAAFAPLVLALLSWRAQASLRPSLRLATLASALTCLGFLAGPPYDHISDGLVLGGLITGLFLVLRS